MAEERFEHAIVVGASSGMGYAIARKLAQAGTRVAVVARREQPLRELEREYPDRIVVVVHDVKDTGAVPALFQDTCHVLGGLDLIVYASGVMPAVGPNEFDMAKDREMVEVNLLGAMAWLNEAAVRFQNTGRGAIVGIGSVAGDRGRQGQPGYNTSKAALHTYLEALRNRLSRYGVTVCTVKPGPVATPMTEGLNIAGAMDVELAAERILKKARRNGETYLKLTHRLAFAVIRSIPSPIFRKLKV